MALGGGVYFVVWCFAGLDGMGVHLGWDLWDGVGSVVNDGVAYVCVRIVEYLGRQ